MRWLLSPGVVGFSESVGAADRGSRSGGWRWSPSLELVAADRREDRGECLLVAVDASEYGHQIADLDVLERADRVLDLACEAAVDAIGRELVEFFDRVAPGERARRHPWVVLDLVLEHRAVIE